MATQYLDSEGLDYLIKILNERFEKIEHEIELLNDSTNTPGSIQYMINSAIEEVTTINGGTAPTDGKEG